MSFSRTGIVTGFLGALIVWLLAVESMGQDSARDLSGNVSDSAHLTISDCKFLSIDEVNRILRIELQSILVSRQVRVRPIQLNVECRENSVTLRAVDAEIAEVFVREIDPGTLSGDGEERVVAIAAAELTLSVWERMKRESAATSPEKHPAKPAAPADSEPKKPDNIDKPAWELTRRSITIKMHAGALWRIYPKTKNSQFGGEWGGRLRISEKFMLDMVLTAEGGRVERSIGEVGSLAVTSMIGAGVYRTLRQRLTSNVLLGFRGGYGRMKGRANNPAFSKGTVQGFIGGPLLRFSLWTGGRTAVGISSEIGYEVFGISGNVNGEQSVAMTGFWVLAMFRIK